MDQPDEFIPSENTSSQPSELNLSGVSSSNQSEYGAAPITKRKKKGSVPDYTTPPSSAPPPSSLDDDDEPPKKKPKTGKNSKKKISKKPKNLMYTHQYNISLDHKRFLLYLLATEKKSWHLLIRMIITRDLIS